MGYYVNKNKKGGWSLVQETFAEGKSVRKTVDKGSYSLIGFSSEWALETAREKARQLNQEQNLSKKLTAKSRVDEALLVHDVYLPDFLTKKFKEHLLKLTTPTRHTTIQKHWSTVQKNIIELKSKPEHFFKNRDNIFILFEKNQYSADYSNKLLRVLNLWGQFCADEIDTVYRPVHFTAYQKSRLALSQEDKTDVRREAKPLTPEILINVKGKFENAGLTKQWNWLFCTLWFGLRPSEMDSLLKAKTLPVRLDPSIRAQVLSIRQGKLKFARKDLQTKHIPIHFNEQKMAFRLIETRDCKRPLVKTIRRIIGEGFDTYSGRKGFTDLMIEKKFMIEDVALMLGHSKLDTLMRHYKNRSRIRLPG